MKIMIRLALPGLVLVAVAAIALYKILPAASKAAVQYGSQSALGVQATIEEVPLSLSATSARVGMNGLLIPNPPGFGESAFLRVGHASVELETFSVLKDVIQIKEIRLEGTELRLLQKGTASNLQWFLKQVSSARGAQETQENPPAGDDPGPLLAVDLVVVSGLRASLTIEDLPLGVGSWEVTLPPLELNLSAAEPGDSSSLLREVMREIVAAGLNALRSELPPETWQVLSPSSLQGLLEGVLKGSLQLNGKVLTDGLQGKQGQAVLDEVLRNLPAQLPKGVKLKD
ncbi:MAG TPA: hypothetical protein EYQ25_13315 [Planctomycetes bacterium]|nr:hypothetical protein [Planctomycetota bacterium]HIL38604.1 hypothetical protein [Planctomycetota bacterium]